MVVKNSRSRFLRLVFLWCVLWLNDASYSKSVWRDKWEHACYKHAGTTFSPVHQPWEPECTASQTDRQTDGRITPIADRLKCFGTFSTTHCSYWRESVAFLQHVCYTVHLNADIAHSWGKIIFRKTVHRPIFWFWIHRHVRFPSVLFPLAEPLNKLCWCNLRTIQKSIWDNFES